MKKIEELKNVLTEYTTGAIVNRLNEVIQAVNDLKRVGEEQPIYETLSPSDILVLSKSEEGLLIAVNDGNGRLQFERVKYPEEDAKNA